LEIFLHRNYIPQDPSRTNLQKTKSLSLVFPSECKLDISDFLSSFTTLKNLLICDFNGAIPIYSDPKPNLDLEALKLTLSQEDEFRALQLLSYAGACVRNSQLKHVDIRLTHLKDDLFKELLTINDALSPLKMEVYHLEVRDPKRWNSRYQQEKKNDFQLVPLTTNMLRQLTNQLSKLKLLKILELELYLEEPRSVSNIEALFDHFPNLAWLELNLYHNQESKIPEPTLMDMPIYKLQKLTHFNSTFTNAFQFKDLIGFFERTLQMKHLERLKVQCVSIDNARPETIEKIGEFLDDHKKLIELYIGRYNSIYFDRLKENRKITNNQ